MEPFQYTGYHNHQDHDSSCTHIMVCIYIMHQWLIYCTWQILSTNTCNNHVLMGTRHWQLVSLLFPQNCAQNGIQVQYFSQGTDWRSWGLQFAICTFPSVTITPYVSFYTVHSTFIHPSPWLQLMLLQTQCVKASQTNQNSNLSLFLFLSQLRAALVSCLSFCFSQYRRKYVIKQSTVTHSSHPVSSAFSIVNKLTHLYHTVFSGIMTCTIDACTVHVKQSSLQTGTSLSVQVNISCHSLVLCKFSISPIKWQVLFNFLGLTSVMLHKYGTNQVSTMRQLTTPKHLYQLIIYLLGWKMHQTQIWYTNHDEIILALLQCNIKIKQSFPGYIVLNCLLDNAT